MKIYSAKDVEVDITHGKFQMSYIIRARGTRNEVLPRDWLEKLANQCRGIPGALL